MTRIAVIQTSPVFGEVRANVKAALEMMGEVDADIFVLPELFNTGYNFVDQAELEKLSETISGFTFQAIETFAKSKTAYVVYGFAEKHECIYNSAALVGPEGLVGLYRKVHLFDREMTLFTPGNVGFPVFDLPFGRIGIMICFDWIYPESARTLALRGAELIAHPANLVLPHCPDAMVTRCLENRVFAATANRVGRENRGGNELHYIGKSEIVSPRGEILMRLGDDEAGVAAAEVDLALAKSKRVNAHNDLLMQRRPDQYESSLSS